MKSAVVKIIVSFVLSIIVGALPLSVLCSREISDAFVPDSVPPNFHFMQQSVTAATNVANVSVSSQTLDSLLGQFYEMPPSLSLQEVKFYAEAAIQTARQQNNLHLQARAYQRLSQFYTIRMNESDSAMLCASTALSLARRTGDTALLTSMLITTALTHLDNFHNYHRAEECAIECVRLAERQQNMPLLGFSLNIIGDVYLRLGNLAEARQYCRRSLEVRERCGDKATNIAWSLHNVGLVEQALGQIDTAITYHRRSLTLWQNINDKHGIPQAWKNLGIAYTLKGRYNAAVGCLQISLYLRREISPISHFLPPVLLSLSDAERLRGRIDTALRYSNEAYMLARTGKMRQVMADAAHEMALLYKSKRDYSEALRWEEHSHELHDSLAKRTTAQALNELELRFQNEQKLTEQTIRTHIAEQQRTTTLALSVAAVLMVSGLVGTLYFRIRAASARRLLEESEKMRRAVVQATFNGVELERKRVQRELHDGIQSKLISEKIAFSTAHNVLLEQAPQVAANFMRTLNSFGTTINEISDIAQNLIPANFEERGLAVAVEDFISAMRSAMPHTEILLNVEAVSDKRFASDRELSVFRLVQEIVNNCRKHAEAESLVVDFALEKRVNTEHSGKEEEWLIVTGEDEGRGFSSEILSASSGTAKGGLGLSTMQNRVHALGGTIIVDSAPERGTRIVAAIPLEI
ncbi:MAG: hypothetical protein EAZ92_00795 [Candidatus Kapaibacterium sp.]|nr:MAG: hypothetical protein EAZ92_00795 [Candidatus Kapabacteria bacterium]